MKTGILYVVATPIGNLGDISLRAIETLRSVDLIAAEDTRHSQKLLQHYQLQTPLISYHEHNEKQRAPELIAKLLAGKNIALITDAGTPLISDPGSLLIAKAQENNIAVTPIPGATAVITALSVSGLPLEQFIFAGFLPAASSQRKQRLSQLCLEQRTWVLYEAPHRITGLLTDIVAICGAERLLCLAKELTKIYETFYKATAAEALNWLQQDAQRQKGEFVVVVQGYKPDKNLSNLLEPEATRILQLLRTELPLKTAVTLTTKVLDLGSEQKKALYQWGTEHKN